jgi:hypothetical protein
MKIFRLTGNSIYRRAVFSFFLILTSVCAGQDAYLKEYGTIPISIQGNQLGSFPQPDSTLITAFSYYSGLLLFKTDYAGIPIWARVDSSNRAENRFDCKGIKQCRDGNFLAYGNRQVPVNQNGNTSVMKIDTAGNVIWNKTYSNISNYMCYLDTTIDQGFILSASTRDTSLTLQPVYPAVFKADSMGNVIWCRYYVSDSIQGSYDLFLPVETTNGDILYFSGPSVIKADSSGSVLYAKWKQYQAFTTPRKIYKINSNFYLELCPNNGYSSAYDSTGSLKWRFDLDTKDIVRLSDSTFVTLENEHNVWTGISIEKFDTSGTALQRTFYNFGYQIFPNKFNVLENGRYYVSGAIDPTQMQDYNLFILKTLVNGSSGCGEDTNVWQRALIYDSLAPYVVNSFAISCSVLADTIISNTLTSQIYVDSLCYQATAADEIKSALNNFSVFPNPANSQVTVTGELPIERIIIYNMLSEEGFDQRVSGGLDRRSTTFNISNLSPGIYSVKIQTKDGIENSLFIKQ